MVRAFEEQNRIVSGYKGRETSFKFEGFKGRKWHKRRNELLLPDRQTQGRQVSKWQSPSIGPRVMLFPGDDWADWMDGWMFMKRTPKKRSTLSSGGLRGLDHHSLRGNQSGLQSRGQFLIFFNYKSGGISN